MAKSLRKIWKDIMQYKEISATLMMALGIFATCIMFYSNVVQALDDVKVLKVWRDTTAIDISAMKQDLHDLHEWYKEDHKK